MKKCVYSVIVTIALLSVSFGVKAQQNYAETYLKTGQYDAAKGDALKLVNSDPARAYYVLGEVEYQKGDMQAARDYFQKGIEASIEFPFNYVGMGKTLLTSDKKAAEAEFAKALSKKFKKDPEVIIAVTRAYYENGMESEMNKNLEEAKKYGRKSPFVYEFEGDRKGVLKDVGGAAADYGQSVGFDETYLPPYMKLAEIYRGVPNVAINWLERVTNIAPNYMMAYKLIGDVNFKRGSYKLAADAYEKFFNGNEYETVDDLIQYTASLYFTDRSKEAMELTRGAIDTLPNNFILNRLMMYASANNKEFDTAEDRADKFFSLELEEDKPYISRDFTTFGDILVEQNNIPKAIEQYGKAADLDSLQITRLRDLARKKASERSYQDAIDAYKVFALRAGDQIAVSDYLYFGSYCYTYGRGITVQVGSLGDIDDNTEFELEGETFTKNGLNRKAKGLLERADSVFTLLEQGTDSHHGSLYRARVKSLLEKDIAEGQAKEFYAKTVKILQDREEGDAEEKFSKELVEAYTYLALHHYETSAKNINVPENRKLAKEYSDKILALDSGNNVATQVIDMLKQ